MPLSSPLPPPWVARRSGRSAAAKVSAAASSTMARLVAAGLSCQSKATGNRNIHSLVDIGICQDNRRVFAAHLQLHTGEILHRLFIDTHAHVDRTRKADTGNLFAAHQRIAHQSPRTGHNIEHAFGQTCLNQRFTVNSNAEWGTVDAGLKTTVLP